MSQRVWIELDRPRDEAQAKEIACLANTMLERLNGEPPEQKFQWSVTRGCWMFGGNWGYVDLPDSGQWFNLEHFGRPLV